MIKEFQRHKIIMQETQQLVAHQLQQQNQRIFKEIFMALAVDQL